MSRDRPGAGPFPALAAQVSLAAPALGELLRGAWGDEVLRPQATYQLRLDWTGPGEPQEPLAPPVTVPTSQGPLALRGAGNAWQTGGGGVSFEIGADQARVSTLPELLGPHASEADQLALHLAMTEVGRASGLLPLHAAVLTRSGQTVAVSGESGSSKSTAALRLLGLGWTLVAEDSAWLDPQTMRVAGADEGLRLRGDSLRRFPTLELGPLLGRDRHGKRWYGAARASGATLDRLYLLDARQAPGVLSPAAAVRALWSASGLPLTAVARQAVALNLAGVVRQLPLEVIDRDALIGRLA
jgi:hypothetical protein